MSAINDARYQQFLNDLRAARPSGAAAPAPKGEMLRLAFLINVFRWTIGISLPVLALGLFLTPLIVRLVFDSNALKPLRTFFGLAAIGLIVAWWRAFIQKPKRSRPTVVFDRMRDRRLYELADAIAEAVGSPPVHEIGMSPFSNFGVHEEGKGKRRTLHLNLDAYDFEGLTLLEFSSILAHEFAHFSKGHTAHGLKLWRKTRFLYDLEAELEKTKWKSVNPVYWSLRLFERTTEKLMASISRGHERQADAMALELLGGAAAMPAHEKVVKNALRSDALMHTTLGRAIQEGDRKADWIEAMREHEFSADELEILEERWLARLNQEEGELSSHPSIRERLQVAAQAGTPLVQLEDDATPAYTYLLGKRSEEVQRTLAREAVESNLEYRATEPGLRGGTIEAERVFQLRAVTVQKFRTGIPVAWMVSSIVGLLFFGAFFALSFVVDDIPPEAATLLGVMVFVTLAALLWSLRARTVRMHAGPDGLDLHGFFGTTRVPWDDVTAARMEDSRLTVFARTGGSRHKMRVRGDDEKRRDLEDLVLELSPVLAYAAWGTGLSRVPEPGRNAALPERVYELDKNLHIEGPEQTRIVIEDKDPRHEAIHEHLETRLLPAMLAAE